MELLPAPCRKLTDGQIVHLYAYRGTRIRCKAGIALMDSGALWLAEQLLRPRIGLAAGATHIVEHDGWIAIHAQGDAEIAITDRASSDTAQRPLGRAFALLGRLLPLRMPREAG